LRAEQCPQTPPPVIQVQMDAKTLRLMLGGLKSFFPALHPGHEGTDGRTTAAYCYSVWMRHLSLIAKAVPSFNPRTVVELGPRHSLGVGFAALLSGAEQYVGLDVVPRANLDDDVKVLGEIVALFEHHAPIPDGRMFPDLEPALPSYGFPNRLFADDGTRRIRVDHERVASIRAALLDRHDVLYDNVPVGYVAPWGPRTLDRQSVDLVMSQAALQDMAHEPARSELAGTFAAMSRWLRKGGVMSHQINFSFPHGPEWNHHWRYPDAAWRMVRGNRQLFENRVPLSTYLALCEESDFEVVSVKRVQREGLPRERAAPRFRDLPEEDFHTSSAHIVAVRR
jgi:hypothetical protein